MNKMESDLVEIVENTRNALAVIPPQNTELSDFTSEDERILTTFLQHERNAEGFLRKYKRWEALYGRSEIIADPIGTLEKARQEFKKSEPMIREAIADDLFGALGLTDDVLTFFGDIPRLSYKTVDMTANKYRLIVAYARQIGTERDLHPQAVVSDQFMRDEIQRRMFPTRGQYDLYYLASAKVVYSMRAFTTNLKEGTFNHIKREFFKATEGMPRFIKFVLGTRFIYNIARDPDVRELSKWPQKETLDDYTRDLLSYITDVGNRIYGNITTDVSKRPLLGNPAPVIQDLKT